MKRGCTCSNLDADCLPCSFDLEFYYLHSAWETPSPGGAWTQVPFGQVYVQVHLDLWTLQYIIVVFVPSHTVERLLNVGLHQSLTLMAPAAGAMMRARAAMDLMACIFMDVGFRGRFKFCCRLNFRSRLIFLLKVECLL